MDLTYGPDYERFRGEVRAFLEERWRPSDSSADVAAFRKAAVDAGYLYRSVPRRYGGSEQPSDVLRARVIREEFTAARAPVELKSLGTQLLVPTLLEAGAEWQRERFIEATITGQIKWCQGYSEPGAGSDLASLRTTAMLVKGDGEAGGRWVISGQKVWTSFAHEADYMFLLARTDPDAAKHSGISYLLVPMDQPGIEVRPLRQITGESEFNEVFLTDATTGADWIVGRPGQGWEIANATLRHERAWVGDVAESDHLMNSLIRLASRTPGPAGLPWIEDRALCSRLMEVQGYVEAHRYSGYVQLSRSLKGEPAGALGLTNKISSTNIAERIAAIAIDILGDASLLPHTGPGHPAEVGPERWMYQYFGSIGSAIAGGASNIQRNIIAQRGLGLPRDPERY
ncbi:MAG TPA: acyl-CoA dehydrogenase family protein [Streptosporangiaceae bacterium]|jgi:alkylation response protein AidB-like acyl-CoA dehydrogenase|nr:acyl-CoA dehydrogenase family protein [Streptosporangiaceae bacterium]